jgi:sulfur-oxidizing protein SoxZ
MAAVIKIRGKVKDGIAKVKTLMPHPMETGTRRDPDGAIIPAHYIETVTCFKNDAEILTAHWGPSVSKNPYFAFQVKNAAPGDTIKITWQDNKGESSAGELILK